MHQALFVRGSLLDVTVYTYPIMLLSTLELTASRYRPAPCVGDVSVRLLNQEPPLLAITLLVMLMLEPERAVEQKLVICSEGRGRGAIYTLEDGDAAICVNTRAEAVPTAHVIAIYHAVFDALEE